MDLNTRTENILVIRDYLKRVTETIRKIDYEMIIQVAETIKTIGNATMFIAGNGGSASISSHFTVDLLKSIETRNRQFRLHCLNDSVPTITATGNDISFESIFSRQIKSYGRKGDLLFVISSSGNSNNILNGLQEAKRIEMQTIALTGFDGGKAAQVADISIHVPTEIGDYGVVEDVHSSICHAISSYLKL